MMTGPVIDGLAKCGRFAVERCEGRLCRRKSGFGGTPRFRGEGARGFCQRYGGFCLFAVSARFLLRGQGGIALCLSWGRFGEAGKLLLQALKIALAAIEAGLRPEEHTSELQAPMRISSSGFDVNTQNTIS